MPIKPSATTNLRFSSFSGLQEHCHLWCDRHKSKSRIVSQQPGALRIRDGPYRFLSLTGYCNQISSPSYLTADIKLQRSFIMISRSQHECQDQVSEGELDGPFHPFSFTCYCKQPNGHEDAVSIRWETYPNLQPAWCEVKSPKGWSQGILRRNIRRPHEAVYQVWFREEILSLFDFLISPRWTATFALRLRNWLDQEIMSP